MTTPKQDLEIATEIYYLTLLKQACIPVDDAVELVKSTVEDQLIITHTVLELEHKDLTGGFST